jgi:hypothetical protein
MSYCRAYVLNGGTNTGDIKTIAIISQKNKMKYNKNKNKQ